MTLDQLITNEGKLADYDTSKFYDSYNALQTLTSDSYDITSIEGAELFKKVTGYDVSKMTETEAEHLYGRFMESFTPTVNAYAQSNFEGLFGELDENSKANIAISHIPGESYESVKELKKDEKDVYEMIRERAHYYTNIIEEIERKPEEFLNKEVNELSKSLAGQYILQGIGNDFERHLEIRKKSSIRALSTIVGSYGFDKFVSETRNRISPQFEKYQSKTKDISQKVQGEIQSRIEEEGAVTISEKGKIKKEVTKNYEEKFKSLEKAYPDANIIPQMNQEVISPAYRAIEEKKRAKAAKQLRKESNKKNDKKSKKLAA